MLYAIDTEFIEDGQTIHLISIGLVAEDGRALYIQICEAPIDEDRRDFYGPPTAPLPNDWVRANVLPHLEHPNCLTPCEYADCPWLHTSDVADAILGFIADDQAPIFWGYYSAYDWVALCQLFGSMSELPTGWPMYCRDLRQWLDEHELEGVVQGDTDEQVHHALADAHWIMRTYKDYVTGAHANHKHRS